MTARIPRACGVGVVRIQRDMRSAAIKYCARREVIQGEGERMSIPQSPPILRKLTFNFEILMERLRKSITSWLALLAHLSAPYLTFHTYFSGPPSSSFATIPYLSIPS